MAFRKLIFNSYFGSFIEDAKVIVFKYEETENLKIRDLKTKTNGAFTVCRFIRWVSEEVVKKNQRRMREAVIFDDNNGVMPISLWKQHIDQIDEEKCLNITNVSINPFVPNAHFLYPLKISENFTVFLFLQG